MLNGFSDRSLTAKVVDKNFPFVDDIPPDPEVPPAPNNKKKIGFSKKLVRDYKLDTDGAVLNGQLRELAVMYCAQKAAPSPLNSRDKERRFKKISNEAIKLATILDFSLSL